MYLLMILYLIEVSLNYIEVELRKLNNWGNLNDNGNSKYQFMYDLQTINHLEQIAL